MPVALRTMRSEISQPQSAGRPLESTMLFLCVVFGFILVFMNILPRTAETGHTVVCASSSCASAMVSSLSTSSVVALTQLNGTSANRTYMLPRPSADAILIKDKETMGRHSCGDKRRVCNVQQQQEQ